MLAEKNRTRLPPARLARRVIGSLGWGIGSALAAALDLTVFGAFLGSGASAFGAVRVFLAGAG